MFASTFALISCFMLKNLNASPFTRQLFSTAMGLFIHYYVFGMSGLASLVTNIFSYFALVCMPRGYAHIAIFTVSGIGLALSQAHKYVYNYGVNGLDVPMNLMFNYCRVTSLACNLKDGAAMVKAEKSGGEPDLKSREKKYAIQEFPSFFDFISYLYFCGAAISGPFYEYKDFMQMIRKEGDFKNVPSTFKPAMLRFANAWMCVVSGAILAQFFDEEFLVSDEFINEYSIPRKLFY